MSHPPPLPPLSLPAKILGVMGIFVAIVVMATLIVMVFGFGRGDSTGDTTEPPTSPRASSSEFMACRDFTSLANDAKQGLLTPTEIRARLQDIHHTANAEPSRVAELSAALLRMATQGQVGTTEYSSTIAQMLRECIRVSDSRR